MGFFDALFGGSPEKQLQKHRKRMKHKDSQQEDRIASIHWLAENGSPEAIYALLGRFEMTYEHHMKDNQEKVLVEELVLNLGDAALPALLKFIPKTKQFARPLALYERLAGREKCLDLLLEMLEMEKERSELKADKKRHVLIKLAEFKDPRIEPAVLDQLSEFDEGVRYAAAEVLAAQEANDSIRDALLDRLDHDEEDSNRLRVRIAEIAHSRGWSLAHRAESIAANPPANWSVVGDRLRQG